MLGFPWESPSVQFNCSVASPWTLRAHGLQPARLPCPSPSPRACSNSCRLSQLCHPTIFSSVLPFSCLQYLPASGSFLMNQLFAWGVQSIEVSASASILPINIQGWFPFRLTGLISLLFKGLKSSPTPRSQSINSSVLSFLYGTTLTSIHDHWKTQLWLDGPLLVK